MKRRSLSRTALAAVLMMVSGLVSSHDGHEHAAPATDLALPAAGGAQWVSADELFVPKSLQRALGLRTATPGAAPGVATQRLLAELVPDPASPGLLAASQTGRLTAAGRWPLPGQTVAAGDILAWLQPILPQRDDAARRARLAEREEALRMADINAERLRVQAAASEGEVNTANIYREKAEMDLQVAKQQRDLAAQSLQGRVALRAPFAGALLTIAAREGELVAPGQPVFELADPSRLRIALTTLDSTLAKRLRSAQLIVKDGARAALQLRGEEALGERPGWRLSFDFAAPSPQHHAVGEIVTIELTVDDEHLAGDAACLRDASGVTAWQHVDAERFRRVRLSSCAQLGTLARSGRWVSTGAALLAQYR